METVYTLFMLAFAADGSTVTSSMTAQFLTLSTCWNAQASVRAALPEAARANVVVHCLDDMGEVYDRLEPSTPEEQLLLDVLRGNAPIPQ